MAIRRRKIRELVKTLLKEMKVTNAPVPVWEIARMKGAKIVIEALDGDLSGFLYQDSSQKIIGVNTQQATVRQNFTVAHELAHLLLHDQEGPLHVDRAFQTIRMRDDVSSQGVDQDEIEANFFAAEILMPEKFLRHDLAGRDSLDLYEEDFIPELTKKYGVSVQALTFRLQYLGYIDG